MWKADIGCYEQGKTVNLPGVLNLNQALKLANKIIDQTDFSGLEKVQTPYVVQVYNFAGKIVFDYMNGGYAHYMTIE